VMQSEHVVLPIVAMPFNPRVYQLPLIQQPLFRSLPRPLLTALCPLPTAFAQERVCFVLDLLS